MELSLQAAIQIAAIEVFPLKDTGPFTLQNRHFQRALFTSFLSMMVIGYYYACLFLVK